MLHGITITPLLLIATAYAIVRGEARCRFGWLAWLGLAVTMLGDTIPNMLPAPYPSRELLASVLRSLPASFCWILFLRHHATLNFRLAAGLVASFATLFIVRFLPSIPSYPLAGAIAVSLGATAVCVAYACGHHALPRLWRYGCCVFAGAHLMTLFDFFARRPERIPLYEGIQLLSLAGIAIALVQCTGTSAVAGARIRDLRRAPFIVMVGGVCAMLLLLWAMRCCPNTAYNPCMRMLSYLGRTQINGVHAPLCHDLFMAALAISAGCLARFYPALSCLVKNRSAKALLRWGGALNAAGLLTIAFIPENVSGTGHNIGCFAAACGGAIIILLLTFKRNNPTVSSAIRWGWMIGCATIISIFSGCLLAHHFHYLPFAPYVPTLQKIVILSFVAWLLNYAGLLLIRTRRPARCPDERTF